MVLVKNHSSSKGTPPRPSAVSSSTAHPVISSLLDLLSVQLLCAPQGRDRVNAGQLLKSNSIYTSHLSTWNVALWENTQLDVFCWRLVSPLCLLTHGSSRLWGKGCSCTVLYLLSQILCADVHFLLWNVTHWTHSQLVQAFSELRFGVGSSLHHPWRNCRMPCLSLAPEQAQDWEGPRVGRAQGGMSCIIDTVMSRWSLAQQGHSCWSSVKAEGDTSPLCLHSVELSSLDIAWSKNTGWEGLRALQWWWWEFHVDKSEELYEGSSVHLTASKRIELWQHRQQGEKGEGGTVGDEMSRCRQHTSANRVWYTDMQARSVRSIKTK